MKKRDSDRQCLNTIPGSELSAVTFVRDYVQLDFDGPTVTAYTWPVVTVGGVSFSRADRGFRDSLCNLIGSKATDAFADPGDRVQILFFDGSSLSISLRPDDRIGEEAVVMSNPQTKEWSVW